MLRRKWSAVFLLIVCQWLSARTTSPALQDSVAMEQREHQVSRTLRRASQYVDVPHISSRPACANVQPPEALTTPNPLITSHADGRKVKVSFIIGTDGRVHSPLILESAGMRAIGAYCRPFAHGGTGPRPATEYQQRQRGRSSFPVDSIRR